ncbi:MAG: aspartate--ammonia ligase, partial [Candidatus Aenigmatarchaeota archaeon]
MSRETVKEIFPIGYRPKLGFLSTEMGIKLIKDTFEKRLAEKLSLTRVSAPRFLITGTGLQDDLAGTQEPVAFKTKFSPAPIEIVHSLAKWKRAALHKYGFGYGTGLYTDMDAIRKDEEVSPIHSIYVDQWDWERVISDKERTDDFLKEIVKKIYEAVLETEEVIVRFFPELKKTLPKQIGFIRTEELEKRWPALTPKEREDKIAKELGAVFVMGIGYKLRSGEPHDLRAADYDDWSLCGDIIVWDHIREKSLELSSMGIRVDKESLMKQLKEMDQTHKKDLDFHKGI